MYHKGDDEVLDTYIDAGLFHGDPDVLFEEEDDDV